MGPNYKKNPVANAVGADEDELTREFMSYISAVSDAVVQSHMKQSLDGVQDLLRQITTATAPLQDTADLSSHVASLQATISSKLCETQEELTAAMTEFGQRNRAVLDEVGSNVADKVGAMQSANASQVVASVDELLSGFQTTMGADSQRRAVEVELLLAEIRRTPQAIHGLEEAVNAAVTNNAQHLLARFEESADRYLESVKSMPEAMRVLGTELASRIQRSADAASQERDGYNQRICNDLQAAVSGLDKHMDSTQDAVRAAVRGEAARLELELKRITAATSDGLGARLRSELQQVHAETLQTSELVITLLREQGLALGNQLASLRRGLTTAQRWLWALGGLSCVLLLILTFVMLRK
jgi:hypothetical protein